MAGESYPLIRRDEIASAIQDAKEAQAKDINSAWSSETIPSTVKEEIRQTGKLKGGRVKSVPGY